MAQPWLHSPELIADNAKPDQDGSITLSKDKALHIYEVRYNIKKNLRKRDTKANGWDDLIKNMRSCQCSGIDIIALDGDQYYYLCFSESGTNNILGLLKSLKKNETSKLTS